MTQTVPVIFNLTNEQDPIQRLPTNVPPIPYNHPPFLPGANVPPIPYPYPLPVAFTHPVPGVNPFYSPRFLSDFKFEGAHAVHAAGINPSPFYVQLRTELVQQYCETHWPVLQRHGKLFLLFHDLFVLFFIWQAFHYLTLGTLPNTLWYVCILLAASRLSFLLDNVWHLVSSMIDMISLRCRNQYKSRLSVWVSRIKKICMRDPTDLADLQDPADNPDAFDRKQVAYIQTQVQRKHLQQRNTIWNKVVESGLRFLNLHPTIRPMTHLNNPPNLWQLFLAQQGSTLLYYALTQPSTFVIPWLHSIGQSTLHFMLHILLVPFYLDLLFSFSLLGLCLWIQLLTLIYLGWELFEFQHQLGLHLEKVWNQVHRCAKKYNSRQILWGKAEVHFLEGKTRYDIVSVSECIQLHLFLQQLLPQQLGEMVMEYTVASFVFDEWLEIPSETRDASSHSISILLCGTEEVKMIRKIDLYDPWRLDYKKKQGQDPFFCFLPDLVDLSE